MNATKKTALEKMMKHRPPEVKAGPDEWNARYGGDTMLIPSPLAVSKVLETIPKGKVMTVTELRDILAQTYNADYSCPLTTGIFLRIVAEAHEEVQVAGGNDSWPYWRVIRDNGELIDKFPGGASSQASMLRAEGHTIVPKGSKSFRIIQD